MIRSASTWSFNVSLEILRAQQRLVVGAHSRSFERSRKVTDPQSDLVFKTHVLDRLARQMLLDRTAKAVYTYRDPLDAIVSGMSIFGISFDQMFKHMSISIDTLVQLLDMKAGLFIRYDDVMSDASLQVDRIADYLEHPLSPCQVSSIVELTGRERMRKISEHFETLPADRIFAAPGNWAYDKHTLLHRRHIQDSRTGKGREQLRPNERNLVYSAFKATLDRLDPNLCVAPDEHCLAIDM
jgi:hypothetical protein